MFILYIYMIIKNRFGKHVRRAHNTLKVATMRGKNKVGMW